MNDKEKVIRIGRNVLGDVMKVLALNSVDQSARILSMAGNGSIEIVNGTFNTAWRTSSSALSQTNRYTPDFYDVGNSGRTDLSIDGARFIVGNSAMVLQNSIRLARRPAKYTLLDADKLFYNDFRMKKVKEKQEARIKKQPQAQNNYSEILTGKNRKDITRYSDRLAWNRFEDNSMSDLSIAEKGKIAIDKFRINRYSRMTDRSNYLNKKYKKVKRQQFSFRRSSWNTLKNQTRKNMNSLTRGNDPESTTSRVMYATQKGTIGTAKSAQFLWKRREIVKKATSKIVHPIRTVNQIFSAIINTISNIFALLASIPVIGFVLLALLPVVIVLMIIFTLMLALIPAFSYFNFNPSNIAVCATREYAMNDFIYEAKERNWKDEAIIGTLSYMLKESGDRGTFTYEAEYAGVTGPNGETYDTTLNNDAWKTWMEDKGRSQMVGIHGYTASRQAIGLGLLQDTDVWQNSFKTVNNATRMINFADDANRPWQDPHTQLTWIFKERIENASSPPFDDWGVDPTKDNRSAEEWCRRITAGIGMPALRYTDNSSIIMDHLAHLEEAETIFKNYKAFSYVNLAGGHLTGNPDFSNNQVWRAGGLNPYANQQLYGQCTWFAWGRFYEIYGFDPGFSGNGGTCVNELLSAHPDKFKLSTSPAAGAVFSSSRPAPWGHVGIVIAVEGENITFQEGNINGSTDPYEIAITDWHTVTWTISQFKATYNPTYAVPI